MTKGGFYFWATVACSIACAVVGGWCLFGCGTDGGDSRAEPPRAIASGVDLDAVRPRVVEFCGACHTVPRPEFFRRADWPKEVQQGYDFYFDSTLKLDVPPIEHVLAFYRSQALDELHFEEAADGEESSLFERTAVVAGDGSTKSPAVSHLNHVELDEAGPPVLLACDMQGGALWGIDVDGDPPRASLLGECGHPAHAEPCNLDAGRADDAGADLVVADLGSFLPEDHDRGRVLWLRRASPESFDPPVVLLEDVGRVADVRPADFDADGDTDLVVAEFGWRRTGRISILWNEGRDEDRPRFRAKEIDPRHGGIHVPVVDLDADGRPDFLALISQEHETVVAFLNRGEQGFEKRTVYDSADPAWGSSGIEPVDLDGDGDLDVLYTNGDSFDSLEIKPYHGIQWLENTGGYPFQTHRLTDLPGVHRALPADLDGDGDLDIAAAAMLPERSLERPAGREPVSIVWLEQVSPGRFERRLVKRGSPDHAALAAADFDGDGDVDLAAGVFSGRGGTGALVEFWSNSHAD